MIATNTTCLPSRIAAQSAAKRQTMASASVHHLPMVSTAVLLLVLMMTTAGWEYPLHGRYVTLPRALSAKPQPSARREDVIKVSVSRDGNVFFRNMQIAADDLPDQIREAISAGAERKVYLEVDSRTRYSDVAAVLDRIRAAKISQICFLAEKLSAQ